MYDIRNAKGEVIYEGTVEIHKLLQAEYALGFRQDKDLRCSLHQGHEAIALFFYQMLLSSYAIGSSMKKERIASLHKETL